MITHHNKPNITPLCSTEFVSEISQWTEFFLSPLSFSVGELTALDLSVNDTEITAQPNGYYGEGCCGGDGKPSPTELSP